MWYVVILILIGHIATFSFLVKLIDTLGNGKKGVCGVFFVVIESYYAYLCFSLL